MKFLSLLLILSFLGCTKEHWRTTPDYSKKPDYGFKIPEAPTLEELGALQYGEPPKNHKKIFEKTVRGALKDPDSGKIRNIQEPKRMWGKNSELLHYWLICGEVNAKNSFGGFTGFQIFGVRYYPDSSNVETDSFDEYGASNFTYAKYRTPCNR